MAGPPEAIFDLRGVSKRYGPLHALHPADLALPTGSTTVLIGPSGCGKSTLLRLLMGLIHPDAGTIRFEGEEVRPDNVRALRHRMGYVIQDGGLFPHLTARANAALLARHLRWDRGRINDRIRQVAELTHFPADGLERYPGQLSGGQKQRVGLMRALMLDPDVLLLDEPLGALDPIIRSELQQELRDIFRTLGKSVVLVTHDLAEAAFFADEIILMRSGRVVQRGTAADLQDAPADDFVRRFISAQHFAASGGLVR